MFNVVSEYPERFSSQEHRVLKIIHTYIQKLGLDLSGQNVLTEVGSNNYLYTPIIAALSGAKRVYAWTADTKYGKGQDIVDRCLSLAERMEVNKQIEFSINCREKRHIASADIITNSGFIRPIDRAFISSIERTDCVIPLMYEEWEHRAADLDLEVCKEKNISVAGTWENHPDLMIFSGTGQLAVKLVMEAGYEVYRNKVAIWSSDEFGLAAKSAFKGAGASHVELFNDRDKLLKSLNEFDVIYFCDYAEKLPLIGDNGILSVTDIVTKNPGIGVVHLFGNIDANYCIKSGIDIYPRKNGYSETMTETLAYLGPEPVIALTIAGFKVAEYLRKQENDTLCQPMV
ncbi:hypothetical protein F0237_16820 [Vibrio tubiashii]|uniref:Uncharacterized protein n=1 Tax=Vibrio tubiashii TaxID=29498 RepID=A0AAE5GT77_9VIBR|nr:hypothetical protein [Vibrio tubiashii]NOI82333.1 hypothetical protein [Vibrio tubiashii]